MFGISVILYKSRDKVPAWNKAHRLNFPLLRVNEDVLSKFDSTVGK